MSGPFFMPADAAAARRIADQNIAAVRAMLKREGWTDEEREAEELALAKEIQHRVENGQFTRLPPQRYGGSAKFTFDTEDADGVLTPQ